jgi:hypothetical protein
MSIVVPAARPVTNLLRAFTGPLVWFGHFAAVYVAEALVCITPLAGSRVMIVLVVSATAVAIAALGVFAWSLMRRRAPHGEFLRTIALALAALSALGVTWTTLPALWLPACAAPAG